MIKEIFNKLPLSYFYTINEANNMHENIIIRPADTNDLAAIKGIMNDAILNTTAIYDYYERDDEYMNNWYKDLMKKNLPLLACEMNGLCIGYGYYTFFRPKDGYKFCVEHSIYIHKDYRKKGIGKILLNALIEKAKENGMHTMIAGIDAENKPAINFHKEAGFVQTGYLKEVGYKFSQWLDLVFMERML